MAQQQNQTQTQEDINQLLKVRREKLSQLQESGKDPFCITKFDVTAHSTDVKERGIHGRPHDVQAGHGQSLLL